MLPAHILPLTVQSFSHGARSGIEHFRQCLFEHYHRNVMQRERLAAVLGCIEAASAEAVSAHARAALVHRRTSQHSDCWSVQARTACPETVDGRPRQSTTALPKRKLCSPPACPLPAGHWRAAPPTSGPPSAFRWQPAPCGWEIPAAARRSRAQAAIRLAAGPPCTAAPLAKPSTST